MGILARALITLASHVFLLFPTPCLLLRHLCQSVRIAIVAGAIAKTPKSIVGSIAPTSNTSLDRYDRQTGSLRSRNCRCSIPLQSLVTTETSTLGNQHRAITQLSTYRHPSWTLADEIYSRRLQLQG